MSCPRPVYDALEPTLRIFGKLFHAGEKPSLAQSAKLANNLLAGVAQDPSVCPGDAGSGCGPFEMDGLGWFLVSLPFIMLVLGFIVGAVRKNKENYDAVHNFVS